MIGSKETVAKFEVFLNFKILKFCSTQKNYLKNAIFVLRKIYFKSESTRTQTPFLKNEKAFSDYNVLRFKTQKNFRLGFFYLKVHQNTVEICRLLQNDFGARLVDCSKMRRFLTKVVGFGAIYLSHVDNDRLLQNLPYTCG